MRAPARPEAVARVVELRLEQRRELLGYRLLHHAVDHSRYSELPHLPLLLLGYLHPEHGARGVLTRQDLLEELVGVLLEVVVHLRHAHAVCAG